MSTPLRSFSRKTKEALGVDDAICFESLAEALETVDADAVLVTVPLRAHAPVAIAALNAGKHVLVEKPFAEHIPEAREVVEAAKAAGKTLMVSQNYRFFPTRRSR